MNWPGEVIQARFVGRRKRFFADMRLLDGTPVTAHCANTGSMATCMAVDAPCLLTFHPDPKRKLAYSWQAIQMPDGWVGINTSLANGLVRSTFDARIIPSWQPYAQWRSEPKISEHSRLDACLQGDALPDLYLEIKNVTLLGDRPGEIRFPDAVTTRGTKHLHELQRLGQQGHPITLCFCVQRNSATHFRPAEEIDPLYVETLRRAVDNGLTLLVLQFHLDSTGIVFKGTLPFTL